MAAVGGAGAATATSSESDIAISRRGYSVPDLARNFVQVLGETGPEASGKLLHFTADFICSGGFELWMRLCWDYAFDHIGIASPRIFTYLKQKFTILIEMAARVSANAFMYSEEVQKATAEVVLLLQICPKKAKSKLPVVAQATHMNEDWLVRTALSEEKAVVRKVWNQSSDQPQLFYATNEIIQAITDGALERALFWTRWLIEEDGLMRKTHHTGLSTVERGPATLNGKKRTHPGYFLCAVLAEAYKEFAGKGQVRMHEEFQTLLDFYRSIEKRVSSKQRQDAMILLIQILTEVPRWRVPGAPTLVRDPVVLERAVGQSRIFYTEILRMPPPQRTMPNKIGSVAPKKIKAPDKHAQVEEHLGDVDRAIMAYFGGGM